MVIIPNTIGKKMNPLQQFIYFLGRIALSLFFILSAINQIIDWESYELAISTALANMHGYHNDIVHARFLLDIIALHISTFLTLGVIVELIGGALIFLGMKPKLGAFILILLLIPTTYIFHPFWMVTGAEKEVQTALFFKNVSILGGLLILLSLSSKGKKSALSTEKSPPKVGP